MRKLIEKLEDLVSIAILSEGRHWRIMRKRIREDFRASRRYRLRLAEFSGSHGCPQGSHFNDKSKACEKLHKDVAGHVASAHSASQRAHYTDGTPRIQPHLHDTARAHHAKAAVSAYHHGYIDLANDHAKLASHHEKVSKKLRNPSVKKV